MRPVNSEAHQQTKMSINLSMDWLLNFCWISSVLFRLYSIHQTNDYIMLGEYSATISTTASVLYYINKATYVLAKHFRMNKNIFFSRI